MKKRGLRGKRKKNVKKKKEERKKEKGETELRRDSKHKEVLPLRTKLSKKKRKRKEIGRKKGKRRILSAGEECI